MFVKCSEIVRNHVYWWFAQLLQLRLRVRGRYVERLLLVRIEQQLDSFDPGMLVGLTTPCEGALVLRVVADYGWNLWLCVALKTCSRVQLWTVVLTYFAAHRASSR